MPSQIRTVRAFHTDRAAVRCFGVANLPQYRCFRTPPHDRFVPNGPTDPPLRTCGPRAGRKPPVEPVATGRAEGTCSDRSCPRACLSPRVPWLTRGRSVAKGRPDGPKRAVWKGWMDGGSPQRSEDQSRPVSETLVRVGKRKVRKTGGCWW